MVLGVERGDHVSLWLNNQSEWLFLMFALAKVGAVQVPVNTRFRTQDDREGGTVVHGFEAHMQIPQGGAAGGGAAARREGRWLALSVQPSLTPPRPA